MSLRTAIVLVALFLMACASGPQDDSTKRDPSNLCEAPDKLLGNTRESVIRYLGQPVSQDVMVLPNRHMPNVQDRRVTLYYPGLDVLIHEVPEYKSSFLAQLTLKQNYPVLFRDIAIGSHASDVVPRFENMQMESAELARLECPGELPPTIEVRFDRGRVVELKWIHEPD